MKILIVDDHAVLREGVRRLLLGGVPDAEFIDAATAQEAIAKVRREAPHIVILDINLNGSSGLELIQRLKKEHNGVRVIMFTMYSEPGYVSRALKSGACGYVSKSAPAEELITAVRRVAAGERYLDREVANAALLTLPPADDPMDKLTNREMEILRLLGEGKSLSEIAATFGIAYKTVANSSSRLKEKLGLERTADLIRLSIENFGK
jgi:two-component system invasion response regulator UvrY